LQGESEGKTRARGVKDYRRGLQFRVSEIVLVNVKIQDVTTSDRLTVEINIA
jgi:hypothetical protein